MPLIDISRFPNFHETNEGLARGIERGGLAIGAGLNQRRQEERIQAETLRLEGIANAKERLADTANEFLEFRGYTNGVKSTEERAAAFQRQRKALISSAKFALQNGESADLYDRALEIQNPDELNTYFLNVARRSADGQKLIDEKMGQETFSPVTDASGTVIAQRNDQSNKVIADPRAETDQGTSFQQGTGVMAGYVFNPADGSYSLDQRVSEFLKQDAESLAADEGMLKPEKVAGVNDKVTALIQDVQGIRGAAVSLEALEKRGTPAAQVAAVFKFMKALDPTSTVRDSELGLVYSAEGAAQGMANKLNALLGEGELSESGFRDLVDTAKGMANSAINTATISVDGYLNVLDDKLSAKDMAQMKARVPSALEVKVVDTGYTVEQLRAMTPEQRKAVRESLK